MTKVLITGASGYIGKHVTLQLLNQGYEVRASVRKLSKSAEVRDAVTPHLIDSNNLNSRLTFVELDLEKDSEQVRTEKIQKAWNTFEDDLKCNFVAPCRVLKYCCFVIVKI
jgi:nucleoside-diphosphate-sugar epimerase